LKGDIVKVLPWCEIEDLGEGRFRACIDPITGFVDADGKYKFRELLDEMMTKKCLIVKNKYIGAEIHPTHISYFDRAHSELRLEKEEIYAEEIESIEPQEGFVPRKVLNHWGFEDPTKVQYSAEITANELRIKKWVEDKDVLFEVIYVLPDGGPLKHKITLTNKSKRTLKLWFIMKWTGVKAAKVLAMTREYPYVPLALDVSSPIFLLHTWNLRFLDDKENELLCQDLTNLFETGKVGFTLVYTHSTGTDITFYFLFFEVPPNESVVLDPTTWTNSDPAQDGYVYSNIDGYGNVIWVKNTTAIDVAFGFYWGDVHKHRGYVEWDIAGIPDNAIIDSVKLQYHGFGNYLGTDVSQIWSMENQPSPASASAIHADCGDGTKFVESSTFPVVEANQEINLGPDACSDLQANLGVNWWAIGIKTGLEDTLGEDASIYSEENASANPKPTLVVEYHLPTPGYFYGDGLVAVSV